MAVPTMTDLKPELGTPLPAIETPAVVADLDVMERNLRAYADFAEANDVQLRSHSKTHKVPALAHLQQDYGEGICCQTLSEAEVMAAAGIEDIYISYQVVGERKLDRLVRLAETVPRFATTVDGPGNLRPLQEAAERRGTTIDAVLEVDVGLGRTGVPLGEPSVELAELIAEQPNVRFAGIMGYEGHLAYGEDRPASVEELDERCRTTMDDLADTVERIEAAGLAVDRVGVGSTATSRHSGKHPVVTEIHPGMYPFMDANLVTIPGIEKADCALTVEATIISTAVADQVIVDAGSKSISLELDVDPLAAGSDPGVRYTGASEEHGHVDVAEASRSFSVGGRLSFIPPHVCPTVNLHDTLIGVRDGVVEDVWAVQGRGKVK